jgi:hypothetical protein
LNETYGQRTDDAMKWLDYYLTSKGGEEDSSTTKRDGVSAGYSVHSLARARAKLGVTVFNRPTIPRTTCWALPAPAAPPLWRVVSRRGGYVRPAVPLHLSWELECDPISDDYYQYEISAYGLWCKWISQYVVPRLAAPTDHPPRHVGIYWSVVGDSMYEAAPFQALPWLSEDFLTYFQWPTNAATGKRLRWADLPVDDKLWRPGRVDKGGFIQELTGWKPSPLQPSVDIDQLAAMSGLPRIPETATA